MKCRVNEFYSECCTVVIVQYMICDCCSHYLVVDMCLVPNEANISHLAPNNEYLGTQEVMSATNGPTCQDGNRK